MSGIFIRACMTTACWLAAASAALGQGMLDRPVVETAFELSVSQQFDEEAKPLIVVAASIPYRKLIFFLRDGRYEARYRVFLELENRRGPDAPGRVWEETVTAAGFNETTSAARFASTRRTFPVEPGDYKAVVTVEVIDTSRRFREEQPLRVVGEASGRLELSTPVFATCRADSLSRKPRDGELAVSICPSGEGCRAAINPGGIYGDFDAWARAAFGFVAPSADGGDSLVLTAVVRDARGVVVRYARERFGLGEARHSSLCIEMNLDNLSLGEYEIETVLETIDGAQKSRAAGRFTVLFNAALLTSRAGDLIDLLSLAADERDARRVAEAPAAERVHAWALFWRKLDPTPSTESNEAFGEFLQRLRHVLKAFSRHRPGWRTDMGRIYMGHGHPDRIEDRQGSRLGGNYQLWYYNSEGVVYIFEDPIGSGEYRLLSTEIM